MNKNDFFYKKKILVTGGAGFLGSHVVKKLKTRGALVSTPRSVQYDLRKEENCKAVITGNDIVIHLSANVGGIGYNLHYPGEIFYDNILMGVHMMEQSRLAGIMKFVAVGTICSYPKFTPIPFQEKYLWDGYPEETNAPYGLAKKMLLVQAQAYRHQYGFNAIYLLPVNLYGPGDKFDPAVSHVIPALIKKIVDAKERNQKSVQVWGTGTATREFFYVADAAEGILLATEYYDKTDPVNLGAGVEISIKELAQKICRMAGYRGSILWDASKPDGQPRRMVDTSRAQKEFRFTAKTNFDKGLQHTISWYLSHRS